MKFDELFQLFQLLEGTQNDNIRHAELENKFNDGTITSQEIEEAKNIVNKAANLAGYNVDAFHGTHEKFDEFDPDIYLSDRDQLSGPGINTTDSRIEAANYGKIVLNVKLKLKNPVKINRSIYEALTPSEMEKVNLAVEKDELTVGRRLINGYVEPYADRFQIKTATRDDVAIFDQKALEALGVKQGRISKEDAFKIALKIKEGIISPYSRKYKVSGEDIGSFRAAQDKVIEILKSKKYDGVEYKVHAEDSWHEQGATHKVVFDPSQIKNAEPFTGIPLEQRFDSNSKNINR